MAAKQDSEECPLMPQNLKELHALLASCEHAQKGTESLEYSLHSFQIHRPIGRVMIFLMGQSGTGKSSTINNLFADPDLCETSERKSATRTVTEHKKLIAFSDLKLKAYLSLVDTPGTFDTKKKQDGTKVAQNESNMTQIQQFRSKHWAFWTGSNSRVYPNLVLVTVKASDTRLDESNSFFSQTLRTIEGTKLLDFDRMNLIVAATCSAQLSTKSGDFAEDKQKIRNVIAKVVFNILGISNVKIVFVENKPDNFNLNKRGNCDFHELPDGELTPLNLFEAITDQFKSNGDFFGSLLTSRCFEGLRRVKNDEVMPWSMLNPEEPSQDLKNFLSTHLTNFLDSRQKRNKNNLLKSILRYAGCGYSLREECKKSFPISHTDHARFTELVGLRDKQLGKVNFASVDEYKKYRLQMYGIESITELNFSPDVNSIGRWMNDGDHENYSSFVFEEKLGTVVFGEKLRKDMLEQELRDDLDNLPIHGWFDGLLGRTALKIEQFRLFFDKWGTHYIKEVGIGGSIRVDCCIPSGSTDEQKSDLEENIERKLASLANQEEFEGDLDNIGGDGYYVWVKFCGGIQPKAKKLSEVTPKMFAEWRKTLKKHPTELENTIKLESYAVFLDDKYKKTCFTEAALNYLRCYPPRLAAKRSVEATRVEKSSIVSLTAVAGALVALVFVMKK